MKTKPDIKMISPAQWVALSAIVADGGVGFVGDYHVNTISALMSRGLVKSGRTYKSVLVTNMGHVFVDHINDMRKAAAVEYREYQRSLMEAKHHGKD